MPFTPYVRYNNCSCAPCDALLAICVAAGFLQLRLRLLGVENRAAADRMHVCRMTPKAVHDVKAGKVSDDMPYMAAVSHHPGSRSDAAFNDHCQRCYFQFDGISSSCKVRPLHEGLGCRGVGRAGFRLLSVANTLHVVT